MNGHEKNEGGNAGLLFESENNIMVTYDDKDVYLDLQRPVNPGMESFTFSMPRDDFMRRWQMAEKYDQKIEGSFYVKRTMPYIVPREMPYDYSEDDVRERTEHHILPIILLLKQNEGRMSIDYVIGRPIEFDEEHISDYSKEIWRKDWQRLRDIAISNPRIEKERVRMLKELYCKDPADNTDYSDDHQYGTKYEDIVIDKDTVLETLPLEGEMVKEAVPSLVERYSDIVGYSLENTECSQGQFRRGYLPWMFRPRVFLVYSSVKDQWVAFIHKPVENGAYENKGPYSLNEQAKVHLTKSHDDQRPPCFVRESELEIIVETTEINEK